MRSIAQAPAVLFKTLKWTLLLVGAYAVLAALGDFVVNGLVFRHPEQVTPVPDLIIAAIIGGPISCYLLNQRFRLMRTIALKAVLEKELTQALNEAEVAAQAKSDFLANMTHELRTPLNAVVGFAAVLRGSPTLASADARQVELIHDAGLALLGVVNDVLDFSKLQSGPVQLEDQAFDPEALARGCLRLMEGQAAAKGLELVLAVQPSLPWLRGDPVRLRQVMLNFLSNAVKFTERGRVEARIGLASRGGLPFLRVEMEDTGIGIEPDQIEAVFDRFTQADRAIARRFGGSGLGLAISKTLIQAMGGSIGAHSEPGRGSIFWFEIPAPAAPQAQASPEGAAQPSPGALRGRILVAEDNAVNRELIAALLKPCGVDAEFALNGAEAVEAVARSRFDLVLMDVQMPVMDGLTAVRLIRQAAPAGAERLPIVAMTANVLPEQVQACLAAGMDGHLGKPIHPQTLVETLAFWLGDAGCGSASAEARRTV